MKHKLKLIALLLCIATAATATVRTVNNGGGAQFATIESAVVAASPGDTVYICGSIQAYGGPTTRKANITFIGTGFNVQKQVPVKSTISSTFNVGDNNRVIGLELPNFMQINYLDGISSLTISRCFLSANIGSSGNLFVGNLVIDHCIINITPFNNNKVNNLIMNNNIFEATGSNFLNNLTVFVGATIDHCSFINSNFSVANYANGTINGFSFSNCVFYNSNPVGTGSSVYNNCYSSVSGLPGSGNIVSTVWPFNQSQGSVTGSFNYTWDFSVLTTSAADNGGNDGTDMGAFGGALPFQSDGEPAIPQMDIMNIIGTQFLPGSTMQINFQSTVQD